MRVNLRKLMVEPLGPKTPTRTEHNLSNRSGRAFSPLFRGREARILKSRSVKHIFLGFIYLIGMRIDPLLAFSDVYGCSFSRLRDSVAQAAMLTYR